jgi:UDP-galactopyranose mutase
VDQHSAGTGSSSDTPEGNELRDLVVLTAPLDVFFEHCLADLPWRGLRLESHFIPGVNHELPCGVVNHPGLDQAHTRRIETKWMSGSRSTAPS